MHKTNYHFDFLAELEKNYKKTKTLTWNSKYCTPCCDGMLSGTLDDGNNSEFADEIRTARHLRQMLCFFFCYRFFFTFLFSFAYYNK